MHPKLSEIGDGYAFFVPVSVLRDQGLLVETDDGDEELVEEVTALKSYDPEKGEITFSLPEPRRDRRPAKAD